jgi:iron(III) transport system substrate-binding protein
VNWRGAGIAWLAFVLWLLVVALLGMALQGCGQSSAAPERRVVLYTSTDAPLLPPILDRFMAETGIRVDVVTDTEATKTTGLADRLVSERGKPRADVWWSNEATTTVALAKSGMFEAGIFGEKTLPTDWPAMMRGEAGEWAGMALRGRVIAFNTKRAGAGAGGRGGGQIAAPIRLADFLNPALKGRIGMARPQFGTTRSHIAALVAAHGSERTRAFLAALKANGLRLYHGNSAVVRAIANAEIDVGLTDTDDVIGGVREGWPIGFVFEPAERADVASPALPSVGALIIPNTVAVLRGAPHPDAARVLADFLVSADVEEMLAASESRNVPVRKALPGPAELAAFPREVGAMAVTPAQIAEQLSAADALIAELFPME